MKRERENQKRAEVYRDPRDPRVNENDPEKTGSEANKGGTPEGGKSSAA